MKRTQLKKQSKVKISVLKKKLWKVFSEYIRKRDRFTCFTCGRKGEGSGLHAGHYIPKSIGGIELYFHEKNVHAQCYHDNINLGGYGSMYHIKMIEKYGIDEVNKLWEIKNKIISKWNEQDYLSKIEEYKKKLSTV